MEFPDVAEPDLDHLRMVLVGLGVDERAKRIVNLLARSGLDVQLLTFQAFRRGDEVFLAPQVETVEPKGRSGGGGGGTKEGNRRLLEELAREQGVLEILLEVADFVATRMPAYQWPNKTAFAYSLNEVTEVGRPTQRSYAALWVDLKTKGRVIFSLPDRAIEAAGEAVEVTVEQVSQARVTSSGWTPFELPITAKTWPEVKPHLASLISAVIAGWERTAQASGEEAQEHEV